MVMKGGEVATRGHRAQQVMVQRASMLSPKRWDCKDKVAIIQLIEDVLTPKVSERSSVVAIAGRSGWDVLRPEREPSMSGARSSTAFSTKKLNALKASSCPSVQTLAHLWFGAGAPRGRN